MKLDGIAREVESARAHLAKAARDADGWVDQQRQTFDRDRLTPLNQASAQLIEALGKAQQACQDAARLQAD